MNSTASSGTSSSGTWCLSQLPPPCLGTGPTLTHHDLDLPILAGVRRVFVLITLADSNLALHHILHLGEARQPSGHWVAAGSVLALPLLNDSLDCLVSHTEIHLCAPRLSLVGSDLYKQLLGLCIDSRASIGTAPSGIGFGCQSNAMLWSL